MYALISEALKGRNRPIQVGVIGCGWMGSRVVKELFRLEGFEVRIILSRSESGIRRVYQECGVPAEKIRPFENVSPQQFPAAGDYYLNSSLEAVKSAAFVDVWFETTGDIEAAAVSALYSLESRVPFVTMSSEMDALLGTFFARLARDRDTLYSLADGDQPGVLARLIQEVIFQGFEPVVSGNVKNHYDPYATPDSVRPFLLPGQDAFKICSFADGTKQAFELASVANGFGFSTAKRGFNGPAASRETVVSAFAKAGIFDSPSAPCVDYVLNPQGSPARGSVFVVAARSRHPAREDLEYLKMGPGPYYTFWRDQHLCHLEAAASLAKAVCFRTATLCPAGHFVDVAARAKRDLPAGQKLDGIGGYDCSGAAENAAAVMNEDLLPMGLVPFAVLREPVNKDAFIRRSMVELAPAAAVRLRAEMENSLVNQ